MPYTVNRFDYFTCKYYNTNKFLKFTQTIMAVIYAGSKLNYGSSGVAIILSGLINSTEKGSHMFNTGNLSQEKKKEKVV